MSTATHHGVKDAPAELKLLPQLSERHRQIVRQALDSVVPGAKTWIFGSRATGRARAFSDLDLLVHANTGLSWDQRDALATVLEQSDLPFRVDVVEMQGLATVVKARIATEMRVL